MVDRKSIIYKKIFGINLIIVIFIIGTLDMYIIKGHHDASKVKNLYINDKLVEEVNRELDSFIDRSKVFTENIYYDQRVINDILDFLAMNRVDYFQNKLTKFSNSKNAVYIGIESFTKGSFLADNSLEKISFISYSRNEIDIFNRRNEIKNEEITEGFLNEESNYSSIICKDGLINFIIRLQNPATAELAGTVIFSYSLEKIDDLVSRYDRNQNLMIWDRSAQVVYDCGDIDRKEEEKVNGKFISIQYLKTIEKKYYVNKKENQTSLVIVGKVSKESIKVIPVSFLGSLILIDLIVFAIAYSFLYFKLKRLNTRIGNVLFAMDEVKKGNFSVTIPISKENDELNYISKNFNEMCVKLNDYINKSYLAELEQRKAEMVALQNQINPHFLYNTLESIRMKAICNNDKEVGKMLYSLAYLFRTQLKGKNRIPIKTELEYCKKYVDIFRFRYEGKFEYTINCPDELLSKEIIKFTLQPFIENYFIHGIRLDQTDNELVINIYSLEEYNNDIIIEINDNGIGMDKQKLNEFNEALITRKQRGSSIGVYNANERIIIAYGNKYGIKLEKGIKSGVKVFIRIPNRDLKGGNLGV